MKKLARLTIAIAALASIGLATDAIAQGKTRAEVRQELVEAQHNGLQRVTDASYPDVARIYQQPTSATPTVRATDGFGPDTAGSHAAGSRTATTASNAAKVSCSGPNSFCSIYAGS